MDAMHSVLRSPTITLRTMPAAVSSSSLSAVMAGLDPAIHEESQQAEELAARNRAWSKHPIGFLRDRREAVFPFAARN